jgi:hypothetical protein
MHIVMLAPSCKNTARIGITQRSGFRRHGTGKLPLPPNGEAGSTSRAPLQLAYNEKRKASYASVFYKKAGQYRTAKSGRNWAWLLANWLGFVKCN